VLSDGHRGLVVAGLAAVLVDGFVRATWTISRRQDAATLVVQALDDRLPAADRAAVADEGARLLAFAAADATRHDIQFVAATAGPSETTASPGRRRGRS
jgi:ABC-type branched-subunit amino acid transport system ATPase component